MTDQNTSTADRSCLRVADPAAFTRSLGKLMTYDYLFTGGAAVTGGLQADSLSVGGLPIAPGLPGAAFTVAQLTPYRTYQRTSFTGGLFGAGMGVIQFAINPSVPVSYFQYRLRDASANGNPVVQDWTVFAYGINPGPQNINAYRVSARRGLNLADLRANGDDTTIQLGTSPFGMGGLTVMWGQSEMSRMFGRVGDTTTLASLGITPDPFTSLNAGFIAGGRTVTPGIWAQPSDTGGLYDSAGASEYLRLRSIASNCNQGIVGYAVDGSVISSWNQATNGYLAASLLPLMASCGGAFEAGAQFQGAADSAALTVPSIYYLNQTAAWNTIAAANAIAGFPVCITNLQSIPSTYCTMAGSLNIRGTHAVWALDNAQTQVSVPDMDLYLSLEPSNSGEATLGRHFYRALLPKLGVSLAGVGDIGPSIIGTSLLNPTTLVVTMAQAGGVSFKSTGSWWLQFGVFPPGATTSPITVSGGSLASPTPGTLTATLTLATSQASVPDTYLNPIPITYSGNNSANTFTDDNAHDGDGLTNGRPFVCNWRPFPLPAYPLSLSSPTFTGTGQFGNCMNGGTGYLGFGHPTYINAFSNYRVEASISIAAAPTGSPVYAFGCAFAQAVGCSTGGFLTILLGNNVVTTTTLAIADGVRRRVYIDMIGNGVSASGAGTANVYVGPEGGTATLLATIAYTGNAANGPAFGIRQLGMAGGTTTWTGTVEQLRFSSITANPAGASFPVSTAAYTNMEAGTIALYRLSIDGTGFLRK